MSNGTVEFEKRVNLFAILKKGINAHNESYMQQAYTHFINTQPQFKSMKSTLIFSHNKTLYNPIKESIVNKEFIDFPAITQNNIVFNDLTVGISTSQKSIYDDIFLVKDSIRKINWKITDETRNIAGYDCRRANAIIMDSIYVVAFYTDEIVCSGGPESFTGLPGMILGVALPHEHVTWFATKVTGIDIPSKDLIAPDKGKVKNNDEIKEIVEDIIKRPGKLLKGGVVFFLF